VVVYLVTESDGAAPDPGPMADRPDRFRRLRTGRMAADLAVP
jgi:hypothetical protein